MGYWTHSERRWQAQEDGTLAQGELERHRDPIDMIDIASHLDGNPKAVLFEAAGPEKAQVVGNIMGSRDRLALSMGVDKRDLHNLAKLEGRSSKEVYCIAMVTSLRLESKISKTA